MTSAAHSEPYKNHRFPPEIISHAVWLYFRFTLSYRDIEEMMFARGLVVIYEAIRKWCGKCGQDYANQLRRCRPRPGDKWHLDVRRVIDTEGCKPFTRTVGTSCTHPLYPCCKARRSRKRGESVAWWEKA
jgi:putative transposase